MKKFQILCPINDCTGWVVYIDDAGDKFFSCGECGNVWFDKADLNKDIEQSIVQYLHRKPFYTKKSDGYYPA